MILTLFFLRSFAAEAIAGEIYGEWAGREGNWYWIKKKKLFLQTACMKSRHKMVFFLQSSSRVQLAIVTFTFRWNHEPK